MLIDEIFLSIQGESTESGLPCIFIRTFGCPINCTYCDQPQNKEDAHSMSIEEILAEVKKFSPFNRVCVTGGEPLIQRDIKDLLYALVKEGYVVSVETSGCFPLLSPSERDYRYIMDVKCPSSKVENRNCYKNLERLSPLDDVVFVIADRKDFDFMLKVINKYPISANVLLSPMFNKDNKNVIGKELVDWVLNSNLKDVKIQVQLHKILNVL